MSLLHRILLGDLRLLLFLNGLVADRPALFRAALFATDRGSDLALLLTAARLWFWRAPLFVPMGSGAARVRTRTESRARLLVFGAGSMVAYVVARLVAIGLDRTRPFATWLPVSGPPGVFDGLRTFGAFPSDHAALLGAVAVGFGVWNPWLGRGWAAGALVAGVARVAVGFHYPTDMLVGALIGAAFLTSAMAVYDHVRPLHLLTDRVAEAFAHQPWATVLYGGLALAGLEFALHFRHVLGLIVFLKSRLG